MRDFESLRHRMIENHLKARGIADAAVLQAMREVPREEFVPDHLMEFAYEDSPLPIGEGQTISQPYIVAAMTAFLELSKSDRVLEIGTGSGYAAAVLSRIVQQVYTIERHESLIESARERFSRLGYRNIEVIQADGTLGLPDRAPFDAIVVTAAAPHIPEPLKKQLAVGARLVIPVGSSSRAQELMRVRRISEDEFSSEDLAPVRFVPLIGAAGWKDTFSESTPAKPVRSKPFSEIIGKHADIVASIEETDLQPLLDRIGDARIVLLGEATHGTAEFYAMRARITRELIQHKGFRIVAIEADWPDTAQVNRYINGQIAETPPEKPFGRFPTWMWANVQFAQFVEWVRNHNLENGYGQQAVNLYGLDLYSMYTSIGEVLRFLDTKDPGSAALARQRYGCLTPWQQDPAAYGAAALSGEYKACEADVVKMLQEMLQKRTKYGPGDYHRFMDAVQNARLIANAERYYRVMYYGSRQSWNLRDRHMFDTLRLVLDFHGEDARAVVWEHNSHIGNAAATEMGVSGEENVGSLCKGEYGGEAYLVGFGTDHGTVAAASEWDRPMEVKEVRPAHAGSYESIFHRSGIKACVLPLNAPDRLDVRKAFLDEKLERAIGVVYVPETELRSHYFYATLPDQFDEYVWFDETRAITPLSDVRGRKFPATFPFGV
ncbi:MAG: protein-L-isoaspartate(D-aspartate) O-methyltransferase [Desulfobacteraceae bacterium]|nr:MAG: protein-L-isoaspartate(D-aspartate) O-methyltransferase [Desulfobacteraceae bacterium]